MTGAESSLYKHDEDPRTWLLDSRLARKGTSTIRKTVAYLLGPDALRVNPKTLETNLDMVTYDAADAFAQERPVPTLIRREVEAILTDILGTRYEVAVTSPIGYTNSFVLICTLARKA